MLEFMPAVAVADGIAVRVGKGWTPGQTVPVAVAHDAVDVLHDQRCGRSS